MHHAPLGPDTAHRAIRELAAHPAQLLRRVAVAGLPLPFLFAREGGGTVSLKALLYAPLKALPLAPVDASLLYALLFNAAMFALAWWMWRKRWFVKV